MMEKREGSWAFFLDGPMMGRLLWWTGEREIKAVRTFLPGGGEGGLNPIIFEPSKEAVYERLSNVGAKVQLYILKDGWLAAVLNSLGKKNMGAGWSFEVDLSHDMLMEIMRNRKAGVVLAESIARRITDGLVSEEDVLEKLRG